MKIITDDGQEFAVEHVKMVDVADGDVVILRTKKMMSPASAQRLREGFGALLKQGVRTAVLEEDIGVEILRQPPPKHLYCPTCGDECYLHGDKLSIYEEGTL